VAGVSDLAITILIAAAVPVLLNLPGLLGLLVDVLRSPRPATVDDLRHLHAQNRFADALRTHESRRPTRK
jgi:hypothetical protein